VRRSFESARYLALSADAAYQAVLLALQAEVAATYFTLQGADVEIAVLRQTIDVRTNAFAAIEQRVRAGLGTEFEVQRARVEVAGAEAACRLSCGGAPNWPTRWPCCVARRRPISRRRSTRRDNLYRRWRRMSPRHCSNAGLTSPGRNASSPRETPRSAWRRRPSSPPSA